MIKVSASLSVLLGIFVCIACRDEDNASTPSCPKYTYNLTEIDAGFQYALSIVADAAGNVYVGSINANEDSTYMYHPETGAIEGISGRVGEMTSDGHGNVYIHDTRGGANGNFYKLSASWEETMIAKPPIDFQSLAADEDDNVYFIKTGASNGKIHKITPDNYGVEITQSTEPWTTLSAVPQGFDVKSFVYSNNYIYISCENNDEPANYRINVVSKEVEEILSGEEVSFFTSPDGQLFYGTKSSLSLYDNERTCKLKDGDFLAANLRYGLDKQGNVYRVYVSGSELEKYSRQPIQ